MSIIKHIPESIILDDIQQIIGDYLEEEAQNLEDKYEIAESLGGSSASPHVNIFNKIYKKFLKISGLSTSKQISHKNSKIDLTTNNLGANNLGANNLGANNLGENNLASSKTKEDLDKSFNLVNEVMSIPEDTSSMGIYLYGSVGRGKTMLMKAFFERINIPKEIVHFQSFMQEMHEKMHNLQSKSEEKVIEDLAKSIAQKCELLAIDEFEIKDIADAMLIMRLFDELTKLGVFVFITTNIIPDELYKDGLQRELFIPCIKHIKERFSILYLDSPTDYRFKKNITKEERIFYPITEAKTETLNEIKNTLVDYGLVDYSLENYEFENKNMLSQSVDKANYPGIIKEKSIMVFGREVKFKNTYKDCLFTDFSELICRDFGYADYVNICQEFNIIVLEGVQKIGEQETDKITRFINFIDNAYFYKVLLFISLEAAPEEIYIKGFRLAEFQRSISRLFEMNSKEYFQNRSSTIER